MIRPTIFFFTLGDLFVGNVTKCAGLRKSHFPTISELASLYLPTFGTFATDVVKMQMCISNNIICYCLKIVVITFSYFQEGFPDFSYNLTYIDFVYMLLHS